MRMMKLKNKLTKETLELSYPEFCKKFSNEIQVAFESYKQTAIAKNYYQIKVDSKLESDFYFELHWNFNYYGTSNWYIEKL